MKIIISPAKKMKLETYLAGTTSPSLLAYSNMLVDFLKTLSIDEIANSFKIKGKLLNETVDLINNLDLSKNLSPAILSYDGIQYKYMGVNVFTESQFDYINSHLYILSGLYGVLKPFDEITRYRLEMQAEFKGKQISDLYSFWGDKLYKEVFKNDDTVLNLASLEYSKTIKPYIKDNQRFIDVFFYEKDKDKLIEKGVYAKMMRGTMIKWLSENNIDDIEKIKGFSESNYIYSNEYSTNNKLVFIREKENN